MKLEDINDDRVKRKLEGSLPMGAVITEVEFYKEERLTGRFSVPMERSMAKVQYLYKNKKYQFTTPRHTGGHRKR